MNDIKKPIVKSLIFPKSLKIMSLFLKRSSAVGELNGRDGQKEGVFYGFY